MIIESPNVACRLAGSFEDKGFMCTHVFLVGIWGDSVFFEPSNPSVIAVHHASISDFNKPLIHGDRLRCVHFFCLSSITYLV